MSLKEFFVSRRDEIIIWACGFVYGSIMFVWTGLMISLIVVLVLVAAMGGSDPSFVPMD